MKPKINYKTDDDRMNSNGFFLSLFFFNIFIVLNCGGTEQELSLNQGQDASSLSSDAPTVISIISITPSDGTVNVDRNTIISLKFSHSMNTRSVERAMLTKPLTIGTWEWNLSKTIAEYRPIKALEYDKTYTVRVSTRAKAENGKSLAEEFTARFKTAPFVEPAGPTETPDNVPPRIDSTYPVDGSTVSTVTQIEVLFTKPVDRDTAEKAFSIMPPVEGEFNWRRNDSQLIFNPMVPLTPHTKYTVTVVKTLADTNGNHLENAYRFSFVPQNIEQPKPPEQPSQADTTPPRIVSTSPKVGELDVSLDSKISITFSEPIVPASALRAILIQPSIFGQLDCREKTLIYTPSKKLKENTTYTVSLTQELVDLAGNILEKPFLMTFTTKRQGTPSSPPTAPSITTTNPPDGSTSVSVDAPIIIRFSKPVNQSSTEGAFSITPKTEGNFSWNPSGTELLFQPNESLKEEITYEIKISTKLTDLGGVSLKKEMKFSFTTSKPPRFSVQLPGVEKKVNLIMKSDHVFTVLEYPSIVKVDMSLSNFDSGGISNPMEACNLLPGWLNLVDKGIWTKEDLKDMVRISSFADITINPIPFIGHAFEKAISALAFSHGYSSAIIANPLTLEKVTVSVKYSEDAKTKKVNEKLGITAIDGLKKQVQESISQDPTCSLYYGVDMLIREFRGLDYLCDLLSGQAEVTFKIEGKIKVNKYTGELKKYEGDVFFNKAQNK